MNSKNLSVFLSIVVVILVILLGYIILKDSPETNSFSEQNSIQDNNFVYDDTDAQQPINSNTYTQASETENWKTYNFNGPTKFSIKYPSAWIQTENHVNDYVASFTLTKDSYVINIGQADGGGGDCIFSDTKGPINENFDLDLRKVSFIEISTFMGLLRRYPTRAVFPSYDLDFAFCSQKPDGRFTGAGAYSTPVGGITYKLPSNYDAKILAEMDAIIKTIKQQNVILEEQ